MHSLGTPLLLALALVDPPEPPKAVDYEKELNTKLSQGITPEQNANALLFLAFGPKPEGGTMPPDFYKWLGIKEPPEKGDYLVSIGTFARDHLALDPAEHNDLFDQQGWATKRPWGAKDYPFIGAWLKQNEKPMAIAAEAVKRPKYFNPLVSKKTDREPASLIGVLLPNVQKCRELASLFTARAMLRLHEGKTDEAWADLITTHRLGRHVAHGGTLIELLVGIAIDAVASHADIAFLEHAKLDAKQTLAKLKDLQSLPPMPTPAEKIDVTERYMFRDCLNLVRGGNGRFAEGLIGGGGGIELKATKEELEALNNLDWAPAVENADKWYDRLVEAMKKPNRAERIKDFAAIDAELKALKESAKKDIEKLRKLLKESGTNKEIGKVFTKQIGDVLVSLLLPAAQKVSDARDRQEQIQANLHVAFALVAYQRETGRYPEKLAHLAPKHLAKRPGDVFSGKDLIYKPQKGGFLLYSVGGNGNDDEGRWYDDEPPGDDPRVLFPLPPLRKE